MRRHDRLAWLAACHGILRQYRIRSLDEYRQATPDRLKDLHRFRSTIRELVDGGHPDVLVALWAPGISTGRSPASRAGRAIGCCRSRADRSARPALTG